MNRRIPNLVETWIPPFASIASPVEADNVFRSHGRGVFLINQLMDEVSFDKGGTEIRMRKNPTELPGEPSPDSP